MKLILALIFTLSLSKLATAHDHPSVHGMLIIGQSKIYLSHLPMFHSPHDYQVIIEADISNEGKKTYLKNLESSSELVYTLVPEVFVLPDMLKEPKAFKAKIYKGHFERGGQLIADNVVIEIKKIVYFKKFIPQEVKPSAASYILFGNEEEQFMAHKISTKPDFDLILKVESLENPDDGHIEVVIDSVKNNEPLSTGKIYETKELPVKVKTAIYYETGDLAF